MSVWDDARRGTKFYICYGEETPRGYHTDTIPLFWLPDVVATQTEPSRAIVELWFSENVYHLSFEPGDGKHLFAPTRRVFELMGELKRAVSEYNRTFTQTQSNPVPQHPLDNGWVMYGAGGGGGGAIASVDLGNAQVAVDFESHTLGVPYGGGGGAARNGTELHQHIASGGSPYGMPGDGRPTVRELREREGLVLRPPVEGEWGSLSRPRSVSRRNREPRHMAEREVSMRYGEELPVYVRMVDGTQESCTVEHYNRMVESGRWVGFERI